MTPERFNKLYKVNRVFDKYIELLKAVRALSREEFELLIAALEKSLEEDEK